MPVSSSSTICNIRQSILILLGVVALITRGLLVEFEITNGIRRLFNTNNSTIRYNNSKTTNITNKLAEQTNTSQKNNNTNHSIIIPKIVHQEWKDENLPPNLQIMRNDCIRMNPDWEFKLWTKESNLELITNDYPHLLNLYNSYNVGIKRIDMIRYIYLHKYGGLYIDLDMACMKPFGSIFQEYTNKFIVVNQFKNRREYTNAVMASPPQFDVLFDTIFQELPHTKNLHVIESAGGLFLQYHILSKTINKGKWVEMPFDLFYAQDWQSEQNGNVCRTYESCSKKYPNAITIHQWAHTWAGGNITSSEHQWRATNTSIIANNNYTISPENRNEIHISGIFDTDICWKVRVSIVSSYEFVCLI